MVRRNRREMREKLADESVGNDLAELSKNVCRLMPLFWGDQNGASAAADASQEHIKCQQKADTSAVNAERFEVVPSFSEDLLTAIKSRKNGKALGPDGVRIEMFMVDASLFSNDLMAL